MAAKLSRTQKRVRKLTEKSRERKRSALPAVRPGMRSLAAILSALPDPRRELGREHKLTDILIVALLATVCGCDNWVEIAEYGVAKEGWLTTFLDLPNGIPSHDTFDRVFGLLDPEAVSACYVEWMEELAKAYRGPKLKVIAVDGKTVRGSRDGAKKKPLHVVSAWCARNRLCLGQVATDEKSNEITAIPKLLQVLSLEGALVTIDAMGCQKEIAGKIRAKKGHYLLAVKGNQERLHGDIAAYAGKALEAEYGGIDSSFHETEETGHGRKEYRCARVFTDLSAIRDRSSWPGLACFVAVTTDRTVRGKGESETRYYISSRLLTGRQAMEASRAHWGIENRLHWVLDVVFGEDDSRVRKGHGQENLNVLRKLSLVAVGRAGDKCSLTVRRKKASWDNEYLMDLVENYLKI